MGESFLHRYDRKFLVRPGNFDLVVQAIPIDYQVMHNGVSHISQYVTQYFDTPDYKLYHALHRGKLPRYKVRKRLYRDTLTAFLEVKVKSTKGDTQKHRMKTAAYDLDLLSGDELRWVGTYALDKQNYVPTLRTEFSRLALCGPLMSERWTFDMDMVSTQLSTGQRAGYGDLVIAEQKTLLGQNGSPLKAAIGPFLIPIKGFGKYGTGMARTFPGLKSGLIADRLRYIDKLIVQ
ncbi:MAG: VTC domain-containing protein [Bacteroidetes bacterium]|jgi:hypothetical protein|nr:VTC domain-containing protein [Bacteroidota bacterium]